jgi:hypothetical protein
LVGDSVPRSLAARTFVDLEEAIVVTLRSISSTDATNCIRTPTTPLHER